MKNLQGGEGLRTFVRVDVRKGEGSANVRACGCSKGKRGKKGMTFREASIPSSGVVRGGAPTTSEMKTMCMTTMCMKTMCMTR